MTRTPDISLVWFHQTSPDHQGPAGPPWLCVCAAAKTSLHLSPTGGPWKPAGLLSTPGLSWVVGDGEAHSHGPLACSPRQTKLKDLSVTGTSVTGLLSLSIYLDPHFKRGFWKRPFYGGRRGREAESCWLSGWLSPLRCGSWETAAEPRSMWGGRRVRRGKPDGAASDFTCL